MRSAKVLVRFALAVAITTFAACGGDAPGITDPIDDDDDDEVPVDTAAVNAAARLAATNLMLSQMEDAMNALADALAKGGVPGASPPPPAEGGASLAATLATAPPPDAAKCTFDEATVRHVCPDVTSENGIVSKTWFQFLDADGAPHKLPDSVKTVAIRRFVGKQGKTATKFTNQAGTVSAMQTIDGVDTLMLTGLKGPMTERRLNANGYKTVLLEPEGLASVSMQVPTSAENLVFTPPGAQGTPKPPPYPIGGKITAVVTAKASDKATGSTTTQVTTYDGKTATLTITALTGKVVRICTWDQSSQAPPSCQVF